MPSAQPVSKPSFRRRCYLTGVALAVLAGATLFLWQDGQRRAYDQ